MGFAGMAADTNSPANLLKSTFKQTRLRAVLLLKTLQSIGKLWPSRRTMGGAGKSLCECRLCSH